VINHRRTLAGTPELSRYLGYTWAGQPLRVLVGAMNFPYADFGPILTGTSAGIRSRDNTLSIALRDHRYLLDKPIQTRLFAGTGPAWRADGVDDYGAVTHTCPAGSMTMEIVIRPTTGMPSTQVALNYRNGAAAAGIRKIDVGNAAAGQARFQILDDAGTAFQAAGATLAQSVRYVLSGVVDTARGTMALLVNGELVHEVSVAGSTFNTVLSNLELGRLGGTASTYFAGDLDEVRVWSTARTRDQIRANMTKELLGTETGLSYYNKMNNGTGATATATVGSNMTLTGGQWVGSLEGGADIAGKCVPKGRGYVPRCQPPAVDSANLIYRFSDLPSNAFTFAEDQGVALTNAGTVSDLYATTVVAGSYKVDLTGSYIRLGAKPVGVLAVGFQGDNTGGFVSSGPNLIERMATVDGGLPASQIDASAFALAHSENSAPQGYWTGLEPESIWTICGKLVGPDGGGWLTWKRGGQLTIGTVKAPSSPTGTMSDIVRGTVDRATSSPPVYRWRIGYAHNFVLQPADSLAGSLSEEAKKLRAEPWLYAKAEDLSILEAFPEAIEVTVEAYYANLADAQAEANRRLPIHGVERATYTIDLATGLFVYEIGDVREFVAPSADLAEGKDLLVVGTVEDVRKVSIQLQGWG
jgi:hypothetical protein